MNLFLNEIADEVGLIGVILILISYTLLQLGKVKSNSIYYSYINLLGAVLILFSLYYNWNLASAIIEIFWIIISFFGIAKYYWDRRRKKKDETANIQRFTPIRWD